MRLRSCTHIGWTAQNRTATCKCKHLLAETISMAAVRAWEKNAIRCQKAASLTFSQPREDPIATLIRRWIGSKVPSVLSDHKRCIARFNWQLISIFSFEKFSLSSQTKLQGLLRSPAHATKSNMIKDPWMNVVRFWWKDIISIASRRANLFT